MKKWKALEVADIQLELLNLDHPDVEALIIDEMGEGMDVYYDRRWEITRHFSEWLLEHEEWYAAKRVLVLGAGIGEEALILARKARQLWLNDLSSVALNLNKQQLDRNELVENVTCICGDYLQEDLPEVDLVVASFLVYEAETLKSIRGFMDMQKRPFILMNENLPAFVKLCKEFPHRVLFEIEGAKCVLFT